MNSETSWRSSAEREIEIKRELRRRECRQSLEAWCRVALEPYGQSPMAHHRLLIKELEDIEAGHNDRLMVFMPPGSAKSTYASVLFPAWFMARRPNRDVIGASHGSELAEDFSSRVIRTVKEYSRELNYGLMSESVKLWKTTSGGVYRAAGAGGSITGRRSDLFVIDDPIKGREDADSETIREKVWNWYRAEVITRLKPGARIVIIQCMTGDTPVLMADGTERPLRGVRPGDRVATYEDGMLSASTVRNWVNHGPDRVYEIRTTSGIVVKANERHPFLICEGDKLKWTRLKDLRRGQEICRASGESGKVKSLRGMAATRTPRRPKSPTLSRPTCDFTLDRIEEIRPAGREDVFDIEVEGTENFIANGLVSHNTRWHQDDLSGRLLQEMAEGADQWRVINLPAIAEGDHDPMGRAAGEPLWPEWEGLDALERKRKAVGEREWAALYQQRPAPLEGSLFRISQIGTLEVEPASNSVVRAWDLSATAQVGSRDPDWTVGVKLARLADGRFAVLDVVRVRGGPEEVERTIINTAAHDGYSVKVGLPQDPGQAGKMQVLYYTKKLAGYRVESSPETGDKATRAAPVASQCNVGNLYVVRGTWNRTFLDELAGFPGLTHDDQVDALSRAFGMVTAKAPMNITPSAAAQAMRPDMAIRRTRPSL